MCYNKATTMVEPSKLTFKMERDRAFLMMRWQVSCLRLVRLVGVRDSNTLNLSHREYWKVTWNKHVQNTCVNTRAPQLCGVVQMFRPPALCE